MYLLVKIFFNIIILHNFKEFVKRSPNLYSFTNLFVNNAKKDRSCERSLYYCANYLLKALETSTAQETEAPTIGLLPIPIRPIIST